MIIIMIIMIIIIITKYKNGLQIIRRLSIALAEDMKER